MYLFATIFQNCFPLKDQRTKQAFFRILSSSKNKTGKVMNQSCEMTTRGVSWGQATVEVKIQASRDL